MERRADEERLEVWGLTAKWSSLFDIVKPSAPAISKYQRSTPLRRVRAVLYLVFCCHAGEGAVQEGSDVWREVGTGRREVGRGAPSSSR